MMLVVLSPRAQREIAVLPKVIRARLYTVIRRLQRWPKVSGIKALRGKWSGMYRIRTGDYRVLFSVERNRIVIHRIGHRDRFYEG